MQSPKKTTACSRACSRACSCHYERELVGGTSSKQVMFFEVNPNPYGSFCVVSGMYLITTSKLVEVTVTFLYTKVAKFNLA